MLAVAPQALTLTLYLFGQTDIPHAVEPVGPTELHLRYTPPGFALGGVRPDPDEE